MPSHRIMPIVPTGVGRVKEGLRASSWGKRLSASILRDFLKARLTAFLATDRYIRLSVAPTNPKLSVVVTADERVELTLNCLESLAIADLSSAELICVGAMFSDATKRVLGRFIGLKCCTAPNSKNVAETLNVAVDMARGDHILFVPNNVEVSAHVIESLSMRLPTDGAVVGGLVVDAQGKVCEAGTLIGRRGDFLLYGAGDNPFLPDYQFSRYAHCFVDAPLLAPRDALIGTNGLDTTYDRLHFVDYCLRTWETGSAVVYDPALSVLDLQPRRQRQFTSRAPHDELMRLVDRHRPWLAKQAVRDRASLLSRHPMDTRKRILFIDDRVPHPHLGWGFPRSHLILTKLVDMGYFVTFFPLLEPKEEWSSAYQDIPRSIEILLGSGRSGLEEVLRQRREYYDLVLVSRPDNMASYKRAVSNIPSDARTKVVYDAEALFAHRELAKMRLEGKPPTWEQAEARIAEEMKLLEGCNAVISVSKKESAEFARRGVAKVNTLGHGITPRPTRNGFDQRRNLLFVGAAPIVECPNADAILWFCDQVLAKLQRKVDGTLKLIVAGINNLPRTGLLATSSVVFAGVVPNLESLYNEARLFVAPIRYSAGIPLKVYDAAAHGLPVVATPNLAVQLDWQHERDLLVAESANEFVDQCARLYSDALLWDRLRSGALRRVGTDCSIDAFALKLKSIVDNAIGASPPG